MRPVQWIVLLSAVLTTLLGCSEAPEKAKAIVHAKVDAPEVRVATADPASGKAMMAGDNGAADAGIRRVTLSAEANKRLGIVFADVTGSGTRLEAPYNALLYDASGREWVFVSPAPNVYMRTDIKVEQIDGDKVLYSRGPAAGSKVVTMGAAELYGIEFGVGK